MDMIAGDFFITPHAVEQFRRRMAPFRGGFLNVPNLLAVVGGAFGFVFAAGLAMVLVKRRRKSRLVRAEGSGLTQG